MALGLNDVIAVSSAGVNKKATVMDLVNFLTGQIGTTEHKAADIAARNALSNMSIGDRVEVADATGDPTVDSGWALYSYTGAGWKKVAEEEGLDVVIGHSDLAVSPSPNAVVITNTNGADATLTGATETTAGLLTAEKFTTLDFITATQDVNLDDLVTKSHDPVTTAGAANNNPIQVNGQELSFNIDALDPV